MNNVNPLVSVNILSYNRQNDLRITLEKVFEQDYSNIEVIVIDNASTDGAPEIVEKEFPKVRVVKQKTNLGIVGWNAGFKISKGEYVLALDDDSYPINNTIANGLYQFMKKRNLGIVAYNIYNLRSKEYQTLDYETKPRLFPGCGALIKSEVFNKVGYFNKLYFIYYHELDYSIRCYDNNYEIIYLKDSLVIHNQSMKSRGSTHQDPATSGYTYYHDTVSLSIFILQNFYLRYSFIFFLKYILNRLVICMKYPYIKEFFGAYFKISKLFLKIIKQRRIASYKVQKFYSFGNVPIIERKFYPNFKKPSLFRSRKK